MINPLRWVTRWIPWRRIFGRLPVVVAWCLAGYLFGITTVLRITHSDLSETQLFLRYFWLWVLLTVALIASAALYRLDEQAEEGRRRAATRQADNQRQTP